MKNIIRGLILMLALLCAFSALTACNSEQSNNDNNDGNATTKGTAFYITYEGTKIELGKKADGVLSALGEPKSKEELPDCGDFGKQTKYEYDDLMIYTLTNDNGETIDQIEFLNDIPETEKGVCIGDLSDDVIKAHGEPTKKNDGAIIYTKNLDGYNLHIKFKIIDGEVDEINFIREFDVAE